MKTGNSAEYNRKNYEMTKRDARDFSENPRSEPTKLTDVPGKQDKPKSFEKIIRDHSDGVGGDNAGLADKLPRP